MTNKCGHQVCICVFIVFRRKDQKKLARNFSKVGPKTREGVFFVPFFCGPVDFWADYLPDALLFVAYFWEEPREHRERVKRDKIKDKTSRTPSLPSEHRLMIFNNQS